MPQADSKAEGHTVDVPDTVRVKCPLVRGKLRSIPKCVGCEHHAGFHEQLFNPKLSVAQRFVVRCTFATDRQLFEVEAGQ